MDQRLSEMMSSRARFLTGRHASERAVSDPKPDVSVQDAEEFLQQMSPAIATPKITGGTVASPDDVLILYWDVQIANKLLGVYITFYGDHTCSVIWHAPDGNVTHTGKIQVGTLESLDIEEKLNALRSSVGNSPHP